MNLKFRSCGIFHLMLGSWLVRNNRLQWNHILERDSYIPSCIDSTFYLNKFFSTVIAHLLKLVQVYLVTVKLPEIPKVSLASPVCSDGDLGPHPVGLQVWDRACVCLEHLFPVAKAQVWTPESTSGSASLGITDMGFLGVTKSFHCVTCLEEHINSVSGGNWFKITF